MKFITSLVIGCFSTSLMAMTTVWNCPVIQEDSDVSAPAERLVVEFNKTFQEVTYVRQVPDGAGSYSEKSEKLFSKSGRIRGGISISYCETENGRIALEYNMINWHSRCVTSQNQLILNFRTDLRLDQTGYVQIQVLDLQNGRDDNRILYTNKCY